MKQENHEARSRLPRGIAEKKTVPMRLSSEERERLEALAAKECRSVSSMARLVHLRGMEAIASE